MYKVGDKVRVTRLSSSRDWNVKVGDVFKVEKVDNDGDVYVSNLENQNRLLTKSEIEKVEESEEMTFPEMVQKLIDGEFEIGTELVADNNSYFVDRVMWSNKYGLKSDISETTVMVNLGAHALNSTWTVQKQPTKEMSIEEVQKELGYKIKIVER